MPDDGFVPLERNAPAASRPADGLPGPEPAAGTAAYRRERELALAADPRKRANYERYLAAGRRSAEVDYLPIKLDIENVSRCNYRCRMCVVSEWPKGRRAEDMALDAFRRLIDEQYGLLEIKLQGIGEPTLQRDILFEMIRYARARHIWVRTTTNASLLHIKDNGEKLIDSGVNEVQISIDGATKEVYEGIRVGSVFERVLGNCKRINAYCRARSLARTKMWTVVQKANIDQLEALVELAAELGFPCQVFSLELSDWGLERWSDRNSEVSVKRGLERGRLESLIDLGRRLGVDVRFWDIGDKYRLGHPETLCAWPFERAYIGSDLRVAPCCYVGNPDVYQIDEPIREGHAFADIWRGEAYARFRRSHLEGKLPEVCRACYDLSTPTQGDAAETPSR